MLGSAIGGGGLAIIAYLLAVAVFVLNVATPYKSDTTSGIFIGIQTLAMMPT